MPRRHPHTNDAEAELIETSHAEEDAQAPAATGRKGLLPYLRFRSFWAMCFCEELLAATGADRTTLRVDVPAHDLQVDLTAAEALRPGSRSIRREGSLDQRRLNTVEWLEAHRVDLVQPDFHGDPHPPQALIDVYGVHAQMLGPVQCDGDMTGWLSVHSLTERPWREQDIAALDAARAQAEEIVAPLVRKGSQA